MSKSEGTRPAMRNRSARGDHEDTRAAWHEAGHAVARCHLPRSGGARSVWIDGIGARGGPDHRAACGRPALVLRLADALDRIQVCLAGSVAEQRALGRADPDARRIDRARARETALRVSFEPESEAMLRWLEVRTQRLMEFHWSDVEAVARALLTARSLSAHEIEAVIRMRSDPPKPRRSDSGRQRSGSARRPRPGAGRSAARARR